MEIRKRVGPTRSARLGATLSVLVVVLSAAGVSVGHLETAAASGSSPTFRSLTSANTGPDHLTTLTIATPSTPADGDVLVMFFESSAAIDPSGLAGWTKVDSGDAGSSLRGQSYYRVAASEPASYTLSFTTAIHIGAVMLDYQGVDATAPLSSHGVV